MNFLNLIVFDKKDPKCWISLIISTIVLILGLILLFSVITKPFLVGVVIILILISIVSINLGTILFPNKKE